MKELIKLRMILREKPMDHNNEKYKECWSYFNFLVRGSSDVWLNDVQDLMHFVLDNAYMEYERSQNG